MRLVNEEFTSMEVGTEMAWVTRNNRLLWISGDHLAGLVQIEPPRSLWTGKIHNAPTPSRWRGECLRLAPPRSPSVPNIFSLSRNSLNLENSFKLHLR